MSLLHYNIRDTQKGYREMVRNILAKDNVTLKVGIFQAEGQKPYGKSASGLYDVTVLQIGLWNEFGTATAPPRPFMRLYVDGQSARIHALTAASIRQVVTHKLTKKQALERLGMKMVGEIQQAIGVGYFGAYPPNAPSTIRKKGSSTPLVDTGQLRSSISYRVDLQWETFK